MPVSTDDGGGLAARLDRLDAYRQIRQLPHRYGLALDTRNIDDLVALFIDDVQVGRDKWGRAALREWFVRSFSKFQTSIHFVGNHIIDLDDEDNAHGVVYCRDEIDRPGEWMVGMIQYWDTYERRDGSWFFKRRRLMRWYGVDALTRPTAGAGIARGSAPVGRLPESWPSWQRYWDEVAALGD